MYVSHLECSKCGLHLEPHKIAQLCPTCGAPLLVRYDLAKVKASFSKDALARRKHNLWRYRELLPFQDETSIISLGEVMTPLIPLEKLARSLGATGLYLKDEGLNPGGTFKSRGAAMGVTCAAELGVKAIAMPTNGNAGAAWSIYCAKAGIDAYIVMPVEAPSITRSECAIAGAKLYLVNGLISDAGKIIARAVSKNKWTDASTLKEPYRIEGKKTMGLEIAEQLGWEVPDVILYPTGGGVGIIGIYKALLELREIGWIGDKMPRLVAVQSEGCAPIVKAWEEKQAASEFWPDSSTIAFGINVPKALGDFLVLDAVKQTGGCTIAVSDEEVLHDQAELARTEGLFICPEGAATLSAYKRLLNSGWIKSGEKTVLLNTGSGLKYPNTVRVDVPVLEPSEDIPG
ncbi:threonine synthase [Anaerosporomusa subterranea]|uniref:Threonine synthase n=1 Tax=Anaerosporomusa subterranea TaxID=1794912 RepID=A0A154BLT1_ANASB|nr:threonine synthase [Anaerosporomusa subterranea]KYZ74934.1 threonine synthase [Anaerosporomusa subterranea]